MFRLRGNPTLLLARSKRQKTGKNHNLNIKSEKPEHADAFLRLSTLETPRKPDHRAKNLRRPPNIGAPPDFSLISGEFIPLCPAEALQYPASIHPLYLLARHIEANRKISANT